MLELYPFEPALCRFFYIKNQPSKESPQELGDGDKKPAISQSPAGGFWHKYEGKYRDIMSFDGVYMTYPFLLRYGLITKDNDAVEVALAQTFMVGEKSFNHEAGLPYHSWDYNKVRPYRALVSSH